MALECDPPWAGDIGDTKPEPEPDPDFLYESWIEDCMEELA